MNQEFWKINNITMTVRINRTKVGDIFYCYTDFFVYYNDDINTCAMSAGRFYKVYVIDWLEDMYYFQDSETGKNSGCLYFGEYRGHSDYYKNYVMTIPELRREKIKKLKLC